MLKKKTLNIKPINNIDLYLPIIKEQAITKDQMVFALILTPSIYRIIDSFKILSCFEKLKITPSVISGAGFSVVIAAMYAQGDSIQTIEWKLYKFLRKMRANPYSKKWLKKVKQFIKENISLMKLKKSNKSLWLPHLNTNNKIKYKTKITKEKLYKMLDFNNNKNIIRFNFLKDVALKSLPVDKIILINPFNGKLKFKNKKNNHLLKYYTKLYSKIKKIRFKKVKVITLNLSKNMDDSDFEGMSLLNLDNCKNILKNSYEK